MKNLVIDDVLAIGAACLPDVALVRALFPTLSSQRAHALSAALLLDHHARTETLRHSDEGPALLAALELGRRAAMYPARTGVRVFGPSDIVEIATPRLPRDDERLLVVALDQRLRLARMKVVGDGDESHVDAPLAGILGPVLAAGCKRFVVTHRHPDGATTASASDLASTLALSRAARSVGLRLVDHVIIGFDGHVSMVREGVLDPVRGYA